MYQQDKSESQVSFLGTGVLILCHPAITGNEIAKFSKSNVLIPADNLPAAFDDQVRADSPHMVKFLLDF